MPQFENDPLKDLPLGLVLHHLLRICRVFCCKSRKKGLSVEEKRTRMMDFFYEKVHIVPKHFIETSS